MVSSYLVPSCFFGFGIILEILFALIAFAVAVTAFRIYKISCQNEFRLFGFSFASISASYILIALINLLVVSEIGGGMQELSLSKITTLSLFGLYLHIFLFVSGLMVLCYTTLKLKNSKILILLIFMELFLSTRNYTGYVVSHLLELLAYSIILANLIFLLKHGKKKK